LKTIPEYLQVGFLAGHAEEQGPPEEPLLPRTITEHTHSIIGIDIHPGATIGVKFFIDHGTGVVAGKTRVIGDRVRIYQGVTLGAKSFPLDDKGNPVKGVPRHPLVEDDVIVYGRATILGRVTIGRGVVIGGNVWLTESVPPDVRVTQAEIRHNQFMQGDGIQAPGHIAHQALNCTSWRVHSPFDSRPAPFF